MPFDKLRPEIEGRLKKQHDSRLPFQTADCVIWRCQKAGIPL